MSLNSFKEAGKYKTFFMYLPSIRITKWSVIVDGIEVLFLFVKRCYYYFIVTRTLDAVFLHVCMWAAFYSVLSIQEINK